MMHSTFMALNLKMVCDHEFIEAYEDLNHNFAEESEDMMMLPIHGFTSEDSDARIHRSIFDLMMVLSCMACI
jgi:hypothetical protein